MSKKYDKRKQVRLTPGNHRWLRDVVRSSKFPVTMAFLANRAIGLGRAHLMNELALNHEATGKSNSH